MSNEYHRIAEQLMDRASLRAMDARFTDQQAAEQAAGLFAIAGALTDLALSVAHLEQKFAFVIDRAMAEDAADRGMRQ